ncbi:MAG: hypothetical protein EOO01_34890 [Chitinophagaceae bacterium]|nr:MAG: hypothetical protein EOO01_34890 [Chitinophagaceae bacterium]
MYKQYLWELQTVSGPYDEEFNRSPWESDACREEGIFRIGAKTVPFKTHYFKEIEATDVCWFDVALYTATVENVFQDQLASSNRQPYVPRELHDFLIQLMKGFFIIHPFQLSYIGLETAQEYHLEQFKASGLLPLEYLHFFMPRNQFVDILPAYHKMVTAL